MVRVTRKFVMSGKTEAGGWTARQLEILGVKWPPVHGWINKVCGIEISDRDAEEFIKAGCGK